MLNSPFASIQFKSLLSTHIQLQTARKDILIEMCGKYDFPVFIPFSVVVYFLIILLKIQIYNHSKYT